MFGDSLNTEQRFEYYARYTAMLTEYWRAYRTSAAVMHFCSLGYSRPKEPRGQTSDNFTDVTTLQYEPNFIRHVKPSFAPVGLMIDVWQKAYKPNQTLTVPVHIINDTYGTFSDSLQVDVQREGKTIISKAMKVQVASNDTAVYSFPVQLPNANGNYELRAYYNSGKDRISSTRLFEIK